MLHKHFKMELQERISKIKEYFQKMEIVTIEGKQVIYVGVDFPKGWIIDETLSEQYNVSILDGQDGFIYFACNIEDGIENVFDAIDKNISKMKDAIERAKLLTEKTKELKSLFENEANSVEDLKSLKFIFTQTEVQQAEEILVPQKKKQNKQKQNNNNTETKENTNE